MLGEEVRDPLAVEGGGVAAGLGLLPIVTELKATKTTVHASVHWSDLRLFGHAVGPVEARGYEIHMGETALRRGRAAVRTGRARAGADAVVDDGAIATDGRIVGTYLHGLFDSGLDFRHAFVRAARAACRPRPADPVRARRRGTRRPCQPVGDARRARARRDALARVDRAAGPAPRRGRGSRMTALTLGCAYVADLLVWRSRVVSAPGPVDRAPDGGRRGARAARSRLARRDLIPGAVLSASVVSFTVASTVVVLAAARWLHPSLGFTTDVVLAWTALATGSLLTEARQVLQRWTTTISCRARQRLARIVGRDTGSLPEPEVSRGAH